MISAELFMTDVDKMVRMAAARRVKLFFYVQWTESGFHMLWTDCLTRLRQSFQEMSIQCGYAHWWQKMQVIV